MFFLFLPVVPHLIGVQKFKNKRSWSGTGNQKYNFLTNEFKAKKGFSL